MISDVLYRQLNPRRYIEVELGLAGWEKHDRARATGADHCPFRESSHHHWVDSSSAMTTFLSTDDHCGVPPIDALLLFSSR